MMENKIVLEKYAKVLQAWDDVPKSFFKREFVKGEYQMSCPSCGTVFVSFAADYLPTAFQPNIPIICCGKLLV